jgi:allantoicase
MIVEFGDIELDNNWKTVHFRGNYKKPIILMGAVSYNDDDPVTMRVNHVKPN